MQPDRVPHLEITLSAGLRAGLVAGGHGRAWSLHMPSGRCFAIQAFVAFWCALNRAVSSRLDDDSSLIVERICACDAPVQLSEMRLRGCSP